MSDQLAPKDPAALLERVVITGNLAELTPAERLVYYKEVCKTLDLNPLTKPFDYIQLSGRLVLYAKKEATDQLRKKNGISITKLEREMIGDDVYAVTAYAIDSFERTDSSLGAVSMAGLRGEAKANAMMKAETKAKRRVTLSISGLGVMDVSEAEDALMEDLDKKQPAPPPQTEVITCEADTKAADPTEEEVRALIDEATRLSRLYNLPSAKKKAYMRTHLGAEDYDTLINADPAALKAMIEAMKHDHGAKA